jgi:DHA1 family bicyclomycin/chloramphenicol resistance-like MFS transporter
MNIYKLSEQQYGWLFAFLASAIIGSTQLNHIFLKKFTSEQLIQAALLYQTIIGLVLVAGIYGGWLNVYSLIFLLFIYLTGQGLNAPNATALSLAPFTKHAGSASALMGSFRLGIGAMVSAAVSLLHNNTALPMVGVMAFCSLSSLFILLLGKRIIRYIPNETISEEIAPEVVME